MDPKTQRIYVGNLPFDTTESEVNTKFGKFGKVLSLELKHRSDVGLPCYAFLDLETDSVESCFKKLLRKKWKGHSIKLELAKESFLTRLEKERLNDTSQSTSVPVSECLVHYTTPDVNHIRFTDDSKQMQSATSEKCRPKSIIDTPNDDLYTGKNILDKFETFSDVWKDPPSSLPSKTSRPTEVSGKKRKDMNSDMSEEKLKIRRSLISEEKRLKSLEEKKKSFLQQKEAVKLALSCVDVNRKTSNKLIFNDDDAELAADSTATDSTKSKQQLGGSAQASYGTKNKQSLFDDDESGGEEIQEKDFKIKRQFEGKKGQKLLKLQSQYANDQRFALDERFYESDENADQEENINEMPGTDEVQRQMEILQSIVGHELPHIPERKNNIKGVDNFMLRFDPTIADHLQYETKEHEIEPTVNLPESKKSLKKKKVVKIPNASTLPNVSKDKFYKVANTLKESLKANDSSGFSLVQMFGSKIDTETTGKEEKASLSSTTLPLVNDKHGWTSNPFKYDSSESEGEDLPESTKSMPVPREQIRVPVQTKDLCRENFFFKISDIRFLEGLEFCATKKNADESIRMRRHELQRILSAKVRHNLRKSEPKKKMLGGNRFNKRNRK